MAFSVYADGSLLYSSIELDGDDKIINPKLKVELNKAGSFSFSILPTHSMYSSLHPMKTLITVDQDGVQLFRGRVIECKSDFYKQLNVTCEGDLAFLLDSVVAPFKYIDSNKKTIRQVFKHIVDEHNSQVENWKKFSYTDSYITVTIDDDSSDSATDEFDHTSYGDSSSALTQELLDAYGGILRTRTVGNTTYLDYIKDPSQTNTNYPLNDQEIQFAVNLLDIDQSYPVSDIFTILLPLGGDKVDISSVNNGSKYLENPEAIAKFGRIVKVEQWSDERDKNKLLKKAQEYMKIHSKIFPNDLTVKAIDLHYLDSSNTQLKLGDRVRCVSDPHDINIVLVCLSIDYDLHNPENNSYKLGSYIRSDKHKGKINKSSSKSGRSGGSRRTGSSSTPLSSITAGNATEVEETKEEESTDFWTTLKNIGKAIVGDVTETVGEATKPIEELLTPPGKDETFSLNNLIDNAKNLIFPEYNRLDKDGNPVTDEEGNPITDTVKDLMHTSNNVCNIEADIVEINARVININGSEKIAMNSPVIELSAALQTFIGGYYIKIGDKDTDTVYLTANEIKLTGLIENLIVSKLSANRINTFTLNAAGTIRTGEVESAILKATAKAIVPDLPTDAPDMSSAINVRQLKRYLNGELSAVYNNEAYAKQKWVNNNYVDLDKFINGTVDPSSHITSFYSPIFNNVKANSLKIRNDQGTAITYDDVATQDWVETSLKGGTLTGYFNILTIKEDNKEHSVATRNWVNEQGFAKSSAIPSTDNFCKVWNADKGQYVGTLSYKTKSVLGLDGNIYTAYVVP